MLNYHLKSYGVFLFCPFFCLGCANEFFLTFFFLSTFEINLFINGSPDLFTLLTAEALHHFAFLQSLSAASCSSDHQRCARPASDGTAWCCHSTSRSVEWFVSATSGHDFLQPAHAYSPSVTVHQKRSLPSGQSILATTFFSEVLLVYCLIEVYPN